MTGRRSNDAGISLNDVQSQLNATRVGELHAPQRIAEIQAAVRAARKAGRCISVSGGRHSMGTQQFGTGNIQLDLTRLDFVEGLDRDKGLVTVGAGIMWKPLIDELHRLQAGCERPWTIRVKQTGVDNVTIGGSLSSNIHGRGLRLPPFVNDIESFDLVDATGELQHCSRSENTELFSLAVGGYGLFGIVVRVTLRLARRHKVRRRVCVRPVKELLDHYQQQVAAGFQFGDCQYSIDLTCDPDTHPGLCPFYEPAPDDVPVTTGAIGFSREDWARLYRLIRTNKPQAFEEFTNRYLQTDGQVYWSDLHQLSGNFEGHREAVDARQGTEMITEAYVRHEDLVPFATIVRNELLTNGADVSYGTIRFIEPDVETFLPWARERFACIVCNLHVRHAPEGIREAQGHFRRILDRVVEFGGSFFLTYHRWASPEHVEVCYPRIGEFFRLKRRYDPRELFQSDWYRHYAPHWA
jgi:FAD/FMN-containing dehydrogenase